MAATTAASLARYRIWFLAAAAYNACWGSAVVLAPELFLGAVGIEPPSVIALWQVVGMMVLVFAPAYWWASRDPWAHRHLIVIGAVGKLLGVAGFVFAVGLGQLPLSFGLIVVTNDFIWLPAFFSFLLLVARTNGWRALALGD